MKTEEIKQLFQEFESAAAEIEGVECWSARQMQTLLGYIKWENFEKVIQKAKEACKNAGETVDHHFPDVRKTIPMPKGAEKEIIDMALTRYACYLVAQNGDSRKPEIAFAQNYFAASAGVRNKKARRGRCFPPPATRSKAYISVLKSCLHLLRNILNSLRPV